MMMREHVDPTADERQRAAMDYLVWPLALLDLMQSRNATRWFAIHVRQAALLGVCATTLIFFIMILPLAIVLVLANPSPATVIWIYAPSFFVDFFAIAAAFVYAIRSSSRAARGELFEVPFVWKIASRRYMLHR